MMEEIVTACMAWAGLPQAETSRQAAIHKLNRPNKTDFFMGISLDKRVSTYA